MWVYASVSQPVYRDTQVFRGIFQVCRQILKYPRKYPKKSTYLGLFQHLGVPPNFFSKLVCRKLKKVENHWSMQSVWFFSFF
jgi:hypothetical protein